MITLFDEIENIKERPEMYFVEPISMALLQSYIYGFISAATFDQLVTSKGVYFEYFDSWITGVLPKTLPENRGWRKRIEYVTQNDQESLELFFDLISKFIHGNVKTVHQKTEPKILSWSRGTGNMRFEDFQKIEEIIVRFECIETEHSGTTYRIGYNADNFRVYVEPKLNDRILRTFRYTEIEENY